MSITPIKGIGASFKLDNAVGGTVTDVSNYLDGITGSNQPEELDGTTFQPNVANPTKNLVGGTSTRGYSLSAKHTAAGFAFFKAVEKLNGLRYEYGPEGTSAGQTKISGLCNCISVSVPTATTSNIEGFTTELRVTTETIGTY